MHLVLALQERVDHAVIVDEVVQGLAHAHIVERLVGDVQADIMQRCLRGDRDGDILVAGQAGSNTYVVEASRVRVRGRLLPGQLGLRRQHVIAGADQLHALLVQRFDGELVVRLADRREAEVDAVGLITCSTVSSVDSS